MLTVDLFTVICQHKISETLIEAGPNKLYAYLIL